MITARRRKTPPSGQQPRTAPQTMGPSGADPLRSPVRRQMESGLPRQLGRGRLGNSTWTTTLSDGFSRGKRMPAFKQGKRSS
eukprot:6842585-Alexandrium_andersonii.AAC.1